MGNLGLTELVLMIPGCLIGVVCLGGGILGVIAFFKVRKLEKRLNEHQQ